MHSPGAGCVLIALVVHFLRCRRASGRLMTGGEARCSYSMNAGFRGRLRSSCEWKCVWGAAVKYAEVWGIIWGG